MKSIKLFLTYVKFSAGGVVSLVLFFSLLFFCKYLVSSRAAWFHVYRFLLSYVLSLLMILTRLTNGRIFKNVHQTLALTRQTMLTVEKWNESR